MRVLWISAAVVVIDQLSKAAVVHFMSRRESIALIGDWLKLTYTENPGMAFGLMIGPRELVTVFAVVATALVFWYMYRVQGGYWPYRASLAMVLGGALGNIIDRVFYGVLMGYESLFLGRVVDFIHVDLGYFIVPEIVPLLGGSYIALFPIWNAADMAIVGGVIGILCFQKTFHERFLEAPQEEAAPEPAVPRSNGQPVQPSDSYYAPSHPAEEKRDDEAA